MPSHVWTVVNLETGQVTGTNDIARIEELIEDDNFLCIHARGGAYFQGSREQQDIETIPYPDESDEDEN